MCTCHVISDLMMIYIYCDILSEIMSLCNVMNCSNFIIGSDLNTTFKLVHSNFTKHLNYICEHESIKPCTDFEGNNVLLYIY